MAFLHTVNVNTLFLSNIYISNLFKLTGDGQFNTFEAREWLCICMGILPCTAGWSHYYLGDYCMILQLFINSNISSIYYYYTNVNIIPQVVAVYVAVVEVKCSKYVISAASQMIRLRYTMQRSEEKLIVSMMQDRHNNIYKVYMLNNRITSMQVNKLDIQQVLLITHLIRLHNRAIQVLIITNRIMVILMKIGSE